MKNIDIRSLTGMFLIAVPGLKDPNFERTVVLICEHTKDGAFGLIVNRILLNSFVPLLSRLDIKESVIDLPVFYGGPVKPGQGYILYTPEDSHYTSIRINDSLALTTTEEILIDVARCKGPKKCLFALGFSGWAPGQLEYELMMDSWLVAPMNSKIIFDIPVSERWKAAADSIGIDLTRLVCKQGRV
ncbi:MAG: YqgE/AlgH family protein [Nitrospirota bacterium]